jgi:putative transcriptional regulator
MAQLFDQIDLPMEPGPLAASSVLFGGPVQPDRGFVLHSPIGDWQSSLRVTDHIMLTTSKDVLIAVSEHHGPEHILITLGYAGWSSGQLEEEIASNGWLTVQSDPKIMFDLPAEERYDAAMALLGFDPSLLSGDIGHA